MDRLILQDDQSPEGVEALRQATNEWLKTPQGIAFLRAQGRTQLADAYARQRAEQIRKYKADQEAKGGTVVIEDSCEHGASDEGTSDGDTNPPLTSTPGAARGNGVVSNGGRNWVVVPDGKTAFICDKCEDFVDEPDGDEGQGTDARSREIPCTTRDCDGRVGSLITEHPYLGVVESSVKFFDPKEVAQTSWYHVTDKGDDWYQQLESSASRKAEQLGSSVRSMMPLVHLGTKEAAIARLKGRMKHGGLDGANWRIYEVTINDVEDVSPIVSLDDNQYAPVLAGDLWVRRGSEDTYPEGATYRGVTRYVNQYESAGSMSLLADPDKFTIKSVSSL